MKPIKKAIIKQRWRKVHKLCGGPVVLFTPPNPHFSPHLRCSKCNWPVMDYDIKRVLSRTSPRRNGQS